MVVETDVLPGVVVFAVWLFMVEVIQRLLGLCTVLVNYISFTSLLSGWRHRQCWQSYIHKYKVYMCYPTILSYQRTSLYDTDRVGLTSCVTSCQHKIILSICFTWCEWFKMISLIGLFSVDEFIQLLCYCYVQGIPVDLAIHSSDSISISVVCYPNSQPNLVVTCCSVIRTFHDSRYS